MAFIYFIYFRKYLFFLGQAPLLDQSGHLEAHLWMLPLPQGSHFFIFFFQNLKADVKPVVERYHMPIEPIVKF